MQHYRKHSEIGLPADRGNFSARLAGRRFVKKTPYDPKVRKPGPAPSARPAPAPDAARADGTTRFATAATTLSPRQLFDRNIECLRTIDEALAERLRALVGQMPPLEPTADGRWTARVVLDDGCSTHLHSQRDPRGEAERFIAARLAERRASRTPAAAPPIATDATTGVASPPPAEDAVYLLLGMGLGYHLTALDQQAERPLMIVFEPSLELLAAAFHVTDFAVPLLSRRLIILTDPARVAVQENTRRFHTYLMLGVCLIATPGSQRLRATEHREMASSIAEVVRLLRIQYVTLLKVNRTTFESLLKNLPLYVSQPGIGPLAGAARGYPAIVIGAGPSLAGQFEALRSLQSRAVLIAVQTVYRTLREQGITPHFVTSLDYHEISRQFFSGVEAAGTILVAEPKVASSVPRAFAGRKLLLHARMVDDLLQDAAPARAALPTGTTVAHLAFYLAEHLGCEDILLCGVDLAFSDGLYYAPGMPIERSWTPELGRFRTLEMTQWERIVRIRPILHRVKSWEGAELFTDEPMYTYLRKFEQDFAKSKARIYAAGRRGAALAGATPIDVAEFVETRAQRELPPGLFASADSATGDALRAERERTIAALKTRVVEIQRVREIAAKTLEEVRGMAALLDRPAEFNRAVQRVHALREQFQPFEHTYGLVIAVSQNAELRRIDADRRMRGDGTGETPAAARRRLERDQRFAADFLAGCDYLLQQLPPVVAALQAEAS